jgi:uncharacterized SAM-binding protein YcdF (DUF218 family)
MMKETDRPVALVLGAAVRPGGVPSPALERRALCAAVLWRDGTVRAVVLSGGVRAHPPSEAEVMARVCQSAGVPEPALFLEKEAMTTEENVLRARPLLTAMGAHQVVIVTDRYHAARASLVARRAGLRVSVTCPRIVDATYWRVARAWIREAVALCWYWLRGAGK